VRRLAGLLAEFRDSDPLCMADWSSAYMGNFGPKSIGHQQSPEQADVTKKFNWRPQTLVSKKEGHSRELVKYCQVIGPNSKDTTENDVHSYHSVVLVD